MKLKRITALVLALVLVLALAPMASAEEGVDYWAYTEEGRVRNLQFCQTYTPLNNDTTRLEDGVWYVAEGTLDLNAVTVSGDAHLILTNGCVLNARGITVDHGNSLTIYAQSLSELEMGRLITKGGTFSAGIGGAGGTKGGTVTIHGGNVTATGGSKAAGIGGGNQADGGTVTIYDGIVTAKGGADAAGIGGGHTGKGGSLTVTGGTVIATGGNYGAGIGGGNGGDCGDTEVRGGYVLATGGDRSAGIGGGQSGSDTTGTLTVTGGTVASLGIDPAWALNTGLDASEGAAILAGDTETTAEPVSLTDLGSQKFVLFTYGSAAARIDKTDYGTLPAALAAARSGDTVYLLKDQAVNGVQAIPDGVTLDCSFYQLIATVTVTGSARYLDDDRTYMVPEGETGTFLCDRRTLPDWSLNLDSALRMNFYIPAGSYIRVGGEKYETEDPTGYVPTKSYHAKNMIDTSDAALVLPGDTPAVSATLPVSIRSYADAVLHRIDWGTEEGSFGARCGRLMVSMLNYGAEAQKYFGYHADDLANTVAEKFQRELPDVPAYTDKRSVTDFNKLYYGTSCILGENMNMKFYFRLSTDQITAAFLNYKDYRGGNHAVAIPPEDFKDAGNGYISYTLTDLVAADIDTAVTLALMTSSGDVTVTDSISSYLARVKDSTPKCADLADKMYQFGTLAKTYFAGPSIEDVSGEDELPVD